MRSTPCKTRLALVDGNNFYVSCERVFRPDLIGKPVGVLSNGDGIFVARSQEVKDLGIKMGTPVFQVRHLIDLHKIHLFSSHFAL
jgi:DNA polymerase V